MNLITEALDRIENPNLNKDELIVKLRNLPCNIETLKSQIAGHELGIFKDTLTGYILKPIVDERGEREKTFYVKIFDKPSDVNETILRFRPFLPKFFGTTVINDIQFIQIEDITSSFINPSMMDVKIGIRTYDRNASPRKIASETEKSTINRTNGFRILGVKRWDEKSNSYIIRDREFCKKLTERNIAETLKFYLNCGAFFYRDLVTLFIDKLNALRNWFIRKNINFLEFISSSLFFVYSIENGRIRAHVKMIDFAHVYPLEGSKVNLKNENLDSNYIIGVNCLLNLFERYIESRYC